MNEDNIQVLDILIPGEMEDVKLPSPELVNYYKDYDNRIIFIGDVEEDLFDVTKQIYEYNRQDKGKKAEERKPILIQIMSYGGDLYQAYALVAAILASTTPVYTVNCGVAMSAGFLILLAGHERYAMKYSTAMLHQGSGGAQGTFSEMKEQQRNYERLINQMRDYIIERTSIDTKLFKKNQEKDWYLNCDEQIKYNVVSKVVESLDEIIF